MPHIDRTQRIEALAREWHAQARATAGRQDPHNKRLRARAIAIDLLLADLRERLAAVASTAQELEALIIEETSQDFVDETAAAAAVRAA